jgi:hypothetical protein
VDLAVEWATGAGRGGAESMEGDFHGFVAARSPALFRGAHVLTSPTTVGEDSVAAADLKISPSTVHSQLGTDQRLGFLFLVDQEDSYGSRRGVFCVIADCPPGVLR